MISKAQATEKSRVVGDIDVPPISEPLKYVQIALLLRMILVALALYVVNLGVEFAGRKSVGLIIVILVANLTACQLTWYSSERSVVRFDLEDLEIVFVLAVLRIVRFLINLECVHYILLCLIRSTKSLVARQMLRETTDVGCLYLLTAGNVVSMNLRRLLIVALLVQGIRLVLSRAHS